MKRITVFILIIGMILSAAIIPIAAVDTQSEKNALAIDAASAILMDAQTGAVLYEKNADQALPPASVTKIMTLLLIMEAFDAGVLSLDTVIQTSEYASKMGGSQVYLKAGEEMRAEDLIKSIVIASANDAAVALAEYIAGSEEAFVQKMNERATDLGMVNTNFENTNGLDDDVKNHVTSARDIAIMSRELLRHEKILDYSTIWMDTIRDGAFGLTNTNKLVRFYKGATGLKTGSTSKAKFCISATAKRDDMHLIAVIMASPTRDTRNEAAKKLLDWGFANYTLYQRPMSEIGEVNVLGGIKNFCRLKSETFTKIIPKGDEKKITEEISYPPTIPAPIALNQQIGRIILTLNNQQIASIPIYAAEQIPKITFPKILKKMIGYFSLG